MDIEHPEFVLFLKCAEKCHLRYMCIGGYAVNYYGYHRSTEDLDIWIAPTKENKLAFLSVLMCMGYSEQELSDVKNEDFTTYFMCSLGARPNVIDVLTIVHKDISFSDAECEMDVLSLNTDVKLNFVPYRFLKEIKLRSARSKDLLDIARIEALKNQ